MARRYRFGSSADYVVTLGASNVATLVPGQAITAWSALSGGVQYTDLTLTDGSTPIAGGILTTDAQGAVPEFMGPVDVGLVYLDGSGGSGPRRATAATDLGSDILALNGTVYTPTSGLVDKVANLESQIASLGIGAKERPWEVVVTAATNAAVQAGLAEVLAAKSGNAVVKKLIIPPGNYTLTQPLVIQDAGTLNVLESLQMQGAGISATTLNINMGTTPLISAVDPRLRYFKFTDMTVNSQSSSSVFAYLFSQQGGVFNQRWHLEDVRFGGAWTRGFGLDGGATANLNSEFTFNRVETDPTSSWSDAFFWSGMQNQSQENQFLNYWFQDCNFSLSSGTVFRFTRGGSMTFLNGSWSANSSSNTITWFDLPTQNSNNPNVTQMKVIRVRFEPKSGSHKVLSCNWSDGFIDFDSCADNSSSQNSASYAHERYTVNGQNIWGGWVAPTVRFTNHSAGGHIRYVGGAQTRGGIIIDGGKIYRGDTGQRAYGPQSESGASTADPLASVYPYLRWTTSPPRYDFRNGWNVNEQRAWAAVT